MKINIPLLRKVRAMILNRPKQFQMRTWFSGYTDLAHPASHCGTAACIAGWAVTIGGGYKNPANARRVNNYSDTERFAASLIGGGNTSRLFGLAWWPERFKDRYGKAKSEREQVQVAAARINHFIKTGL